MRKVIAFTLIIVAMMLLDSGIAFSQSKMEGTSNDLGFTICLIEYQVKERVLNNIRHRGTFISGGLSYEKSKEISKHRFELYLAPALVGSRYDPDKASTIIDTAIKYRYARRVRDINQDISSFLGGIAGLNSHVGYYENWDESHFYWLTSYYMGVGGILTYRKSSKSSFWFEANTPLVALVSRPPKRFLYKEPNPKLSWILSELHNDLTLATVNRYLVLNMDLGYTFKYSSKFKQSVFWRLCYTKSSMAYSKDIAILTHTFGTTFLF